MSTLLLRLAGPMQSWGVQSRFGERDTGLEPTKSGVVGMICAAIGVPRTDDRSVSQLAGLRMCVRVDREGRMARDYQTAGGGKWADSGSYGVYKADGSRPDTVDSNRYYLADAVFLVALGGSEDSLRAVERAVRDPVWPIFLGRKAFPPSEPVWLRDGLRPEEPDRVLRYYRWLGGGGAKRNPPDQLRLALEREPGRGQRRMDQPISFAPGRRRYAARYVLLDWVETDTLQQG
ncbi:MAG: type I-E CRISPR-associated protein Cas5/CasD [Actinobacteria bacterium]|nr:type I-E CRISPR-associated protein Cas5/CasD [Actinomycetota bacterium]